MGGQGKIVPNNTHFDTTRANVEISGARAVDLPVPVSLSPAVKKKFKGNMNLKALGNLLRKKGPQYFSGYRRISDLRRFGRS